MNTVAPGPASVFLLASVAMSAPAPVAAHAAPALGGAPPPQTFDYVVKRGDTLYGLAGRYLIRHADYAAVAALNRVSGVRRLRPGATLRIPLPLLRTRPAEATLVNVRGEVSVQDGGAAEPAKAGRVLHEGAIIRTGANAFARLALPDGGHVSLPSQSRVQAVRLRTVVMTGALDQSFGLLSGRVESSVSPVKPGGGFTVRSPIAVSAVRGTEFRVSYDSASGKGATETLKGEVAVAAGSDAVLTLAAQGVAESASGLQVVTLLAAPTLERPETVQTGPDLVFQLQPLRAAVSYRARLGADAGMIDAIAEAESAAGAARIDLPAPQDGSYFVRFTAISSDGVEGLPVTYDVLRARSGLGGLSALAGGKGKARTFMFRWDPEGSGPARFRFVLRRTGGAALADYELTDPQITLQGLPPGDYAWQVRITRQPAGRLVEVWSDPQRLHISR